jgi:coenzyme Q-binding protein COQ10
MATTQTSAVFNCTPEEFFKIVSDYEKYPEFLKEVTGCRIIKEENGKKLVEFSLSLMKTFSYQLWMKEETNKKVSWEFASGDIFKFNSGSWDIADEGGKARATYNLEVEFTLFVPKFIANGLVSVNLPNMISAYHKRVSDLYKK